MLKHSYERILLLTDIPPCKNYTGGIMEAQMIRFLLEEKKELFCFCLKSKHINTTFYEDIINDIDFNMVERPEENGTTKKELSSYYFQINKLKKQLLKYVKENKITKIWCPLQGEVLTLLLNYIYSKTHIPYYVQVLDPIEWWIKEYHFNAKREKQTLKNYQKLLMNSKTCMTASPSMSKYYKSKYKVNSIEIMPSIKVSHTKIPAKDNSKFIIALAGQIYAKDEFDALLTALDKMGWEYNNKKIFFKYYGNWLDSYINKEKHQEYLSNIIINNFTPQEELMEVLSQCDLLYCPYFFSDDKILKKVSELSFPSKLITYLSIKVPTLLHAPSYSSPNLFLKDTNSVYHMNTMKTDEIITILETIMDNDSNELMLRNAKKIFDENFSLQNMKKNFFNALNINYSGQKKLNILEVNNIDLPGRRFNGYDLLNEINNNSIHRAKQIVTYKMSNNKNVITFYKNNKQLSKEGELLTLESNLLSVHSQLSITSDILKNSDYFKNADLIHYHLIHNTRLSLSSMIELCSNKPSVWTIHDTWAFTGRCVLPEECKKWENGCENCEFLNTLFPLKYDNCHSLWKLKKKVYDNLDIDVIVTTPYMLNMVKSSPLTANFTNVHLVPFGIDLDKFSSKFSKEQAKQKMGINKNDIVLFFRAQMAMKGTEYIIEALEMLKTDKHITILSCSETGLLKNLENKYSVIELGHIEDEQMILAYNACDIFLMPSRGESFGMMAIEAMACSLPIIIFNNSALPSVTFAPECGVLVENKDSQKLMEAMKNLIENKAERERRGSLGRKLAEEHYNIKTYHKRLLEIYEKAYERQKNKKTMEKNKYIDFNITDTQILSNQLNYIYKKMFPEKQDLFTFPESAINNNQNYKIDYSLDSVQNLILLFNECIYKNINDFKENLIDQKSEISFFSQFKYLYINNRPELLRQIKQKLSHHKIIYFFFRIIYKILKKVKHIILKVIKNIKFLVKE